MPHCQIHPHSSTETAVKCWEKWIGKRADRKITPAAYELTCSRYIQVPCIPPQVRKKPGDFVEVVYFFEALKQTLF